MEKVVLGNKFGNKFELGVITITPQALEYIEALEIGRGLVRHSNADWGELTEEDTLQNDIAIIDGTRLLSSYETLSKTKFWIITESDRSSTTILLPEDY